MDYKNSAMFIDTEALEQVVESKAPLYHGMGIEKLMAMIDTDTLSAYRVYPRDLKLGLKHGSISLTRNKSFSKNYGNVVLHFNRDKLETTYKIKQVGDFFNSVVPHQARKTYIDNSMMSKSEEIIPQEKIQNVHKYLKAIEILSPLDEKQLHRLQDYASEYDIDLI